MRDRQRKFRRSWYRNRCIDRSPERGCFDFFGGGGGGGGGTVATNTITQSDPWSGVQPYLADIFQRSTNQAAAGPYGGPYIAPQSPYSIQAINQQAQQAQDPNSLVGQAQGELGRTIRGDYLSIDNNPAIQSAVDAARRTVNSQFSGDNYGSSPNREWLARGAADAAAPLLQQERQNQLNALNLAPGLQMANIGQLASAGAAQESRGQAEISAAQQAYQAPWENIYNYQRGIAGGLGAGGQSSTQGSQPYFSNPLAGALGAGIGGLSLYNGLNQAGLLGGAAAATAPGLSAATLPWLFPAVDTGLGSWSALGLLL